MHALPTDATHPGILPLQLYLFPDGLYVVGAMAPHSSLIGSRVTAIGGNPVDEVVRAAAPLVAGAPSLTAIAGAAGRLEGGAGDPGDSEMVEGWWSD